MGRNFNENIDGLSQSVLEKSNFNGNNMNERGGNTTSLAFLPTKDDVKNETQNTSVNGNAKMAQKVHSHVDGIK